MRRQALLEGAFSSLEYAARPRPKKTAQMAFSNARASRLQQYGRFRLPALRARRVGGPRGAGHRLGSDGASSHHNLMSSTRFSYAALHTRISGPLRGFRSPGRVHSIAGGSETETVLVSQDYQRDLEDKVVKPVSEQVAVIATGMDEDPTDEHERTIDS